MALACLLVGSALLGGLPMPGARVGEATTGDIAYRTPEEPLPEQAAAWRDAYQQYPGVFHLTVGDTTYLLISWGEKRTGGYGITLHRIRREGDVLVAEVTLSAPRPGDMVAQVITYPHLLVALPATEASFAAEFKGASWVPAGEGLPPCSPDVFVADPLPLTTVSSPLRAAVVARRELGTLRVSIEDGHDILGTAIVDPPPAGTWVARAVDLDFRPASNPFGYLIVSWKDPASGRWVEKLGVPVRFAPRAPTEFPDLEGHWAAVPIRRALSRGFVNGYPDGRFHPDEEITRSQFLRMVAAAFLTPDDYPDGRFGPDRPATRLEMTVWLIRALGKDEEAGAPESKESARSYRDCTDIPEGLRGYVGLAARLGITTGVPGSRFAPDWHATRAQATTMILRALDTREAAEVAVAFFRRWGALDLEGMKALLLLPPEEFIPHSDIVFAPFYPKSYPDDVPEFFRAARDLVCQYDPDAWTHVTVSTSHVDPAPHDPAVRVTLQPGKAPYVIWADMVLTGGLPGEWRLRMIDSLPVPSTAEVPPSSFSLDRLQPMDVRDLDGHPGVEILGWGFWGEYEGTGPEPRGARGLFSLRDGKVEQLWFTREGPAPDRVWTGEGVMGHLTSAEALDLLLVSRPAYLDGKPVSPEGPQLGLYRLRGAPPVSTPADGDSPAPGTSPGAGNALQNGGQPAARGDAHGGLEKVADVAWPAVAPAGTSVYYGLMAARPLDGVPGDEIVISAFCTPPQGAAYQLVVLCRLEETRLRVLSTHQSPPGQSLYLTFAEPPLGQPATAPAPYRLYVWAWGGAEITALTFRDGEPAWESLSVPHARPLATADVDGDGRDEFVIETARHRLQLLDGTGKLLWETTAYKQVRQAWLGRVDDRAVIVLGEAGADGTRVVRWEARQPSGATTGTAAGGINVTAAGGTSTPTGQPVPGTTFQRVWESPLLGKFTISTLWVRDLERDGDLEIMVTSTDSHLAPADHLHVFPLP